MIVMFEAYQRKQRFVIHEHHALRAGLHYDLRLEHDGILKSWVSRKIPDLVFDELKKIMLILTPDHDLDWLKFKGVIDDGYGKGEVKVWDKGTYTLLRWTDKSIIVKFNGKKIRGIFVLIKTSTNWLFFRKKIKAK